MTRPIPKINTTRLTLSGMRPEDFDRFAEIWANPDVVRHIGQPKSRAEAWEAFLRNAGHWQMTGFGQWAINDHVSRQMIGQTGFFFASRGLGEDFDACPEAGWALLPEAQGSGLGAEATKAAHDWYDRVIPGPLVAIVTEENLASREVAERLGYRLLRRAEMGTDAVMLLRRDGPPRR